MAPRDTWLTDLTTLVASEAVPAYASRRDQGPAAAIGRAAAEVAALVEVDLDGLSGDAVTAALDALHRLEAGVTAVRARLVRAAEKAAVPQAEGAADTTNWLRERFRISGREAKRRTELGRMLEVLPQTRQALAEGRVGEEQAVVLGQAARDGYLGSGADTEATLLDAATTLPPERLRREVRRAEHAADPDSLRRRELRALARRRADVWSDEDGSVLLQARLDPIGGEFVRTALRAFETLDPAEMPLSEQRRPDQRRADALVDLCKAALDGGNASQNGGVKPHVAVVVPYELLEERTSPEAAAAAFAGPVSPEAVHGLLCDAGINRIVADGESRPLDVGRETRNWSAEQRRAITLRDGGCRGPGCDRPPEFCNIHHIRWWERDRGETDVGNGITLCTQHHLLFVHALGWTCELDPTTAEVTWTSPAGTVVVTTRHRAP